MQPPAPLEAEQCLDGGRDTVLGVTLAQAGGPVVPQAGGPVLPQAGGPVLVRSSGHETTVVGR